MDREQRAVTQEEVWALRRQASGEERHGTEGEKRDQRSGVAGVGKDEMGILGSRRLEGAPREERADLARGLGVPPPRHHTFPQRALTWANADLLGRGGLAHRAHSW